MSDTVYADKDGPSYEADVANLVYQCNRLLRSKYLGDVWRERIQAAVECVEAWADSGEDPRRDGWVDGKGRP